MLLPRLTCPMKSNVLTPAAKALTMDSTCMATTEMTSMRMRLNSSKHPHDPDCTKPEKMRPTDL